MKSVIVIILIIILVICGWIIMYNYINNLSNSFISSLEKLDEYIMNENWKIASNEFIKIKKRWSDKRDSLSIIIDHHEIDNIDFSISRTYKYVQTKNKPLSLGEIQVLIKLFNIVKENESLNITNILCVIH